MKWRHFLSFLFAFIWFGQVCPSAPMPGKMNDNPNRIAGSVLKVRESGISFDSMPQRTVFSQNKGVYSIITGHGIAKQKWTDKLRAGYRAQGYDGGKFDNWFKTNEYDIQLDPICLSGKVQEELCNACDSLLGKDINTGKVAFILKAIHRKCSYFTQEIKSSASVAFAFLKDKQIIAGSCGENFACLFEGINGEGIWCPTTSFYRAIPCAVPGNPAHICSQNFNEKSSAVLAHHIDLSGKYFVALMNKAVNNCFTHEQIAQIYKLESYEWEGIAQRVTARLLKIAKRIYEKMEKEWQESLREMPNPRLNAIEKANVESLLPFQTREKGQTLENPELSVVVAPLVNKPFLNNKGKELAEKDLEELENKLVKDFDVNNLLKQYVKPSSQGDDSFADYLVSNAAVAPDKKEKRSWFDKCWDYIANPYFLGTIGASCLSYVIYKYYLK